jgi:tetratricopeptide (TPR) repeat protein
MSNIAKLKKRAAEFEQKRQFDKALAVYVQLIAEVEQDAERDVSVYNRAGDLAFRQGNLADAISYYEQAVDLYAEGGFLNNAIALCNKILRTAPGRTAVYYKLGRISAKKGFTSDARQNFLEYADRMQRSGDLDEAFRALKEFADLCPDHDDVRLMLAEQLIRQRRTSEAIEQLQFLYEKYRREGRKTEAEATLTRMRAIDPSIQPKTVAPAVSAKSEDIVFLDVGLDAAHRRVPLPPGLSLLHTAPSSAVPTPVRPAVSAGSRGTPRRGPTPIAPAAPVPDPVSSQPDVMSRMTPVSSASPSVPDDENTFAPPSSATPARPGTPNGPVTPLGSATPARPTPLRATPLGATPLRPTPLHPTPLRPTPLRPTPLRPTPLRPTPLRPAPLHPTPVQARPPAVPPARSNTPLRTTPLWTAAMRPPKTPVAATPVQTATPLRATPVYSDLQDADSGSAASSDRTGSPNSVNVTPQAGHGASVEGVSLPPIETWTRTPVFNVPTDPSGDALSPRAVDGELPPENPATSVSRADDDELLLTRTAEMLAADLQEWRIRDELASRGASGSGSLANTSPDAAPASSVDRTSLDVLGDLDSPFERESATAHLPHAGERIEIDVRADDGAGLDGGAGRAGQVRDATTPTVDHFELISDGVDTTDPSANRRMVAGTRTTARGGKPSGADERHHSVHLHDASASVETIVTALSAEPGNHALRRRAGEALVERGNRADGLCELDAAMLGYSRDGDLVTASEIAEEILRIEPNAIIHHQRRVEYAFRLNDIVRLTDAYLELGDALVRTGHSEKARVIYQRVLNLDPGDARAQSALQACQPVSTVPSKPSNGSRRVTPLHAPSLTPQIPLSSGADLPSDFVDLGDLVREPDRPKSTRMVVQERSPSGDPDADFAEMLRWFKRGIAENVADEDHESHYDLGIAYKEMGLLDEAVAEFQKALRGSARRIRTYEALGQCFVEQAKYNVAATILQRAVEEGAEGDEQLVGVLYLLGAALEELQRYGDAVACFERVYAVDIHFRDAAERLQLLARAVG